MTLPRNPTPEPTANPHPDPPSREDMPRESFRALLGRGPRRSTRREPRETPPVLRTRKALIMSGCPGPPHPPDLRGGEGWSVTEWGEGRGMTGRADGGTQIHTPKHPSRTNACTHMQTGGQNIRHTDGRHPYTRPPTHMQTEKWCQCCSGSNENDLCTDDYKQNQTSSASNTRARMRASTSLTHPYTRRFA